MIVIVDYGMGNVGSIRNMLRAVGSDAEVTADPARIASARKLILPGVGAFDTGMRNLNAAGLLPVLEDAVRMHHVPILGVCLGMQLMCKFSDEGKLPGLNWIDAQIRRFDFSGDQALKVPHMGWNCVAVAKSNPLIPTHEGEQRFYFVHSYHAVCNRTEDVLARCHHGYDFDAAFSSGNIYGVQFHPEKSHRFGKSLMTRFVAL